MALRRSGDAGGLSLDRGWLVRPAALTGGAPR